MQVPEKLSLIGGSILLASTLVFTLKSQASDILPKVDNGMSSLMKTDQERQQDQQKQQQQAFNSNFQQAQQKSWQTGQWGTAKFYVDDQGAMHVGSGQLNGSYTNVADINKIKTINLDDEVQAPQDASYLFSNNGSDDYNISSILKAINHLSHLDTSHTTNMVNMFAGNSSLSSLDLSNFNTSNVNNMPRMFFNDYALNNLNMGHFNTSRVTNMQAMFADDSSLSSLDLSNFNTSSASNMESMFDYDNIHQLVLGPNIKIHNNFESIIYNTTLNGTYQSNGQTLNLDGNAHPGTWIRQ